MLSIHFNVTLLQAIQYSTLQTHFSVTQLGPIQFGTLYTHFSLTLLQGIQYGMLQAISVWTLWTRPSLVANSRQHPLSPFALIIWIKHIRTYTGTISIWPVKSYDGFQMHNTLRHLTTLWTILIKFCKKNHAKGSYRSAIFVKLRSPNGAAQIVKYWTVLKICRTKCLYWNIKLYLKIRTKCLNALTLWLFFSTYALQFKTLLRFRESVFTSYQNKV